MNIRIHPDRIKANPDTVFELPASVVTDGGGRRLLAAGQVAGVNPDAILIQRALRRADIIETKQSNKE